MNVKAQRKILMESSIVPAPKPYIEASYLAAVRTRKTKKKMTDAEKGAHEAYLFSLSNQGGD